MSPLVPIKKKDSQTRWCIDYQELNAQTVRDSYPAPTVEDIMKNLRDKEKVFSTLDASQAYLSVPLAKDSREYTAFCTLLGLFDNTCMVFRLWNAGTRYNRAAKDTEEDAGEGCKNYVDNTLAKLSSKEDLSCWRGSSQHTGCMGSYSTQSK